MMLPEVHVGSAAQFKGDTHTHAVFFGDTSAQACRYYFHKQPLNIEGGKVRVKKKKKES